MIFVGNAFVKNTAPGTYDVIIVDSSDPVGNISRYKFIFLYYNVYISQVIP